MILLADANPLVHLAAVNGVWVLPGIAPTEMLEPIFHECRHPSQPSLCPDILAAGISVLPVSQTLLEQSGRMRTADVGRYDVLNLYYAEEKGRVLLTNDRPLRAAAVQRGIVVRGTLWIIEEAAMQGLIDNPEAERWILALSQPKFRLPADELGRLRERLGNG